jgi:hypothetical protein
VTTPAIRIYQIGEDFIAGRREDHRSGGGAPAGVSIAP